MSFASVSSSSSNINQKNYGSIPSTRPGARETTRLLEETLLTAYETEDIGNITLDELKKQREALETSKGKLEEMHEITQTANQSLKAIKIKIWRKKLCLWTIIVSLFIVNISLLARMLSNNGKIYHITHYHDD